MTQSNIHDEMAVNSAMEIAKHIAVLKGLVYHYFPPHMKDSQIAELVSSKDSADLTAIMIGDFIRMHELGEFKNAQKRKGGVKSRLAKSKGKNCA